MKTSELTGAALDWAVAMIEKPEACEYGVQDWQGQRRQTVKNGEYVYRWHQSWAQGGPIIDREQFSVEPLYTSGGLDCWQAFGHNLRYDAHGNYIQGSDNRQYGPTPLIAAMRCYVASKLGDDVDVPEELV